MSSNYQPAAAAPKKDNKKIILIVVIAVVVICCCLTALIGGFLAYRQGYLDTILGRLFGGADPVATVLPPETDVYLSMDFLKVVMEGDHDDIINAFIEAADIPDIRNKQDVIDEIDKSLDETVGITMTDDIFPWIGTYIGIGFLDVTMDDYGSPDMQNFIIVIQARDQPKADEFIQKMISEVEDQTGESFDTSDYQGVTIYEMNADYQQIAFGRSKDVVYISTSADNVEKGIDAQKGDSLSDTEGFKKLLNSLGKDRVMLAYISSNFISQMVEADSYSSVDMGSFDMLRAAAVSLGFVDQGMKMDMVTQYDLDKLTDEQKAMLSASGVTVETARYFPSETLLYLTGANLDQAWAFYRELIIQSLGDEGDFNDSMDMFEEQMGFNPDTELFPLMDGAFALGFYDDSDSFLDQTAGVPLGYLGVFETSQSGEVQTLVEDMVDKLGDQMGMSVNEDSSGNLTMYEIEAGNEVVASIGIDGKSLYIGTNNSAVEEAAQKSGGLANDASFKSVWSAFPKSMNPVMYVNLSQMIDMLENLSGENLGVLSPIQALAVASSPLKGDLVTSSILLVIAP